MNRSGLAWYAALGGCTALVLANLGIKFSPIDRVREWTINEVNGTLSSQSQFQSSFSSCNLTLDSGIGMLVCSDENGRARAIPVDSTKEIQQGKSIQILNILTTPEGILDIHTDCIKYILEQSGFSYEQPNCRITEIKRV